MTSRKAPLRKRSQRPFPKEKQELVRVLSAWCRAGGVCFRCKREVGFRGLESHHVYTQGSSPELALCPDDVMPLCRFPGGCHRFAHDHPGEFEVWVESLKPGIVSHLSRLRLARRKKPLCESELEFQTLLPWNDHWEAMKCS